MNVNAKRLGIAAYLVAIHIALIVSVLMYFNGKGTITKDQAKNLGYGFALKECLDRHNSDVNCGSVKVDEPKLSCSESYCKDAPYWAISYKTTQGSTEVTGIIYLDVDGNHLSQQDLQRNYT